MHRVLAPRRRRVVSTNEYCEGGGRGHQKLIYSRVSHLSSHHLQPAYPDRTFGIQLTHQPLLPNYTQLPTASSNHNPPQPLRPPQHPPPRNRIPPLPTLPPPLATPLLGAPLRLIPALISLATTAVIPTFHERLLPRVPALDPPVDARVAVDEAGGGGGGVHDGGGADGTQGGVGGEGDGEDGEEGG